MVQQFVLEILPSLAFPSLNIQNRIESLHFPQVLIILVALLYLMYVQFKIENLPSGSEFKVVVYARNEKGASQRTEVKIVAYLLTN